LEALVLGQVDGHDLRPELRDGLLQLEEDDVVAAVAAVRAARVGELVADDVLDREEPAALAPAVSSKPDFSLGSSVERYSRGSALQ